MKLNLFSWLFIEKIKSQLVLFLFFCFIHSLITFLSWYVNSLFSLILFIPLMFIVCSNKFNFWVKHIFIYLLFFISNVVITFWLFEVNEIDGIIAFVANALFLYFSYPISLFLNKFFKNASLSFIVSYLFVEWVHFNWLFAWPWLTLGNVFGSSVFLIQWYKYTGVLGGSTWILISNYFFFKKEFSYKLFLIIIIPILISIFLLCTEKIEHKSKLNIILSQPNMNVKDSFTDHKKIAIVNSKLDFFLNERDSVDLILLPELFLNSEYWKETFVDSDASIDLHKIISNKFPNSTLLVGATLKRLRNKNISNLNRSFLFDKFNVIAIIDSSNIVKFKTKKEFIPKTENWPNFLNQIVPSASSANYSLSTDQNYCDVSNKRIFMAICYESIFENYCSESLKVNSDFIVLLASESFLKSNSTALNQYLNICKIRAIENDQFFIKCSNEGYSAIINPKGYIEQLISHDEEKYIYYKINAE